MSAAAPEPLRSIWLRPRHTLRWLREHDPERWVLLLPALAGVHGWLLRSVLQGAGEVLRWPGIVALAVIFGPLLGIIGMFVSSALVSWTARWLGGTARVPAVMLAYAWSRVPELAGAVLWPVAAVLLGPGLFEGAAALAGWQGAVFHLILGGMLLASLWSLLVFLVGLSEVTGLGPGRALGALLLAVLLLLLPLLALTLCAGPLALP